MALLIGDEKPSPDEEYLYVFCDPTAPVIISGDALDICDMFCELAHTQVPKDRASNVNLFI